MNYQNLVSRLRQITQTSVLIIHDIMWEPNSIIVLLYIFHIIHPQKQKRSVQPFCFWGEHCKGLSNQADVELDMINTISAADITFIMSSPQVIVNWLNALDQSDFSQWVWCIIIYFICNFSLLIDILLIKVVIFIWGPRSHQCLRTTFKCFPSLNET